MDTHYEPDFEVFWETNKIEHDVGILTTALKEISYKAWLGGRKAEIKEIKKQMGLMHGWKD